MGATAESEALASYAVYDHLQLAAELWRLAGRPDRAREIEETVTSAYEHDVSQLTTAAIEKLLASLAGLRDAAYDALTDEHHLIPAEQLPALRARTELLDVSDARGNDALHAVQEAVGNVEDLEAALRKALQLGAHIMFD